MFAYTDSFYIRTVYDNIEYVYIMHKNDGLPILETIYEGVKEECNGSTFIMNVESKDYDKFVDAIDTQLTFFKNVEINIVNYDTAVNIEFENFKLSSKILEPSILIDDVVYPLGNGIKEHFRKERYGLYTSLPPLCLKFKTGDFKVNLTREDIIYENDEVNNKIINKIKKSLDEFQKVIDKEKSQYITDSYATFKESREKNVIEINDIFFNTGQSFNMQYRPYYELGLVLTPSKYQETTDFTYVFSTYSKSRRNRNSYMYYDKKKVITRKDFSPVEKAYYENYQQVIYNYDYGKRFKRYIYRHVKHLPNALLIVDRIFKQIKTEYQLFDYKPVPQDFIDTYREEQRLLRLEQRQASNYQTEILYRDRNGSVERLYYKADIKYIYSFDDSIFNIQKLLELLAYKKYTKRDKFGNYRMKSISDTYKFIKLNDTNIKKCIKANIKLYTEEDFIKFEPDFVKHCTNLYITYYLNNKYSSVFESEYYKNPILFQVYNRSKNIDIRRQNKKLLDTIKWSYRHLNLDDNSTEYLILKNYTKNFKKKVNRNRFVKSFSFNTNSYDRMKYLTSFVTKYHNFKYLRECVDKYNSRFTKTPEGFRIFDYFSGLATINFVAKNIKHLKQINYKQLINDYRRHGKI